MVENVKEVYPKTEEWCAKIRQIVEERIADGEPEFISREKKMLEVNNDKI